MSGRYWMKFYPADWQSDHLLRSCSIAARGFWIELLCIMQKADPVGHLLVNGKAPAPSLLAVLCGTSEKEIRRLLDELRAAGVFDEADGVIVSRRMVRDAEKAIQDKANGRRGGNPAVKVRVNPPVKPPVEGGDKAQILDTRNQNTLGGSPPIEPAAPDPFEAFWQAYPKREGDNPKKPARAAYASALKRGADPAHLLAAVQHLAGQHPRPTQFVPRTSTWLNEERYADVAAASAPQPVDHVRWQKRLDHARQHGDWALREWGPMPGTAGCLVPADLIQPGDGDGWAPQREAA